MNPEDAIAFVRSVARVNPLKLPHAETGETLQDLVNEARFLVAEPARETARRRTRSASATYPRTRRAVQETR